MNTDDELTKLKNEIAELKSENADLKAELSAWRQNYKDLNLKEIVKTD